MATLAPMITSVSNIEKMAIALICFVVLIFSLRRLGHPRDWLLIVVLYVWFPSLGNLYNMLAERLARSDGTLVLKRSLFHGQDVIFTCNPSNLHHIMSTNFSNYPKGPLTRSIFDVYGEMLFTADHDEWKTQRKAANAYFYDQRLHQFSQKVNREIIEEGLFSILDHFAKKDIVFDLQDVFQRAMLDSTCMTATGQNHCSLLAGLPYDAALAAINMANDQVFMRHILPEIVWKFQRWLGIGGEKKMVKAWEILDDICAKYINRRKNEISGISTDDLEEMDMVKFSQDDAVWKLKDAVKGFLFAGTDTSGAVLSWFFWLLSENPRVEQKIREELEAHSKQNNGEKCLYTNPEELNKLIYLKAAIYETLRLYPPLLFPSRTSTRSDVLPSGHHVRPNTRIVLAYYAIGRMKSIWGEDCLEFKPERWLSDKGGLIPVKSNKFPAFGSGPRICPGKELGLNRAMAVAAAIISKYSLTIMNNNPVTPAYGASYLKGGLIVRVNKISP